MMKKIIRSSIFGLIAGISVSVFSQEKPNILFIAVDDLKPLINSYGEEYIYTPNIDKLSEEGVLFSNAHCQQAVCAPSRVSLLTGMRPDYTGVWDLKTLMRDINPDIQTMPQYFKQNGYTTVAIGKIYDPRSVGKNYDAVSWSIPYSQSAKYTYPAEYGEPALSFYASKESKQIVAALTKEAQQAGVNVSEYVRGKFKPSTECADVSDDAYMDGQIYNNAIKYMDELSGNKEPFFLAVGFKRPHLPFAAPKKYWDLYKRDEVRLAPYQKAVEDGVDIAYHNHGELQSYTDIPQLESFSDIFSNLIPEEKQRELVHGYYASVSYIDALIGKLVSHLDDLELKENTVIVLWGDHGWHLGDHALWCKHSNFEQATRVPFIISYKGIKTGKYEKPVELLDIFPTLCEATGIEIPDQLQGKSLVPALMDHELKIKDYAVSQFNRGNNHGYTLRNERYRYTIWMKDNYRTFKVFDKDLVLDCELYDYIDDPNETKNLYRSKKHKKIVKEMQADFESFVSNQNIALANAGSNPGKKIDTPEDDQLSVFEFNEPIKNEWNLVCRRGAESTHILKHNKKNGTNDLVVDVLKLGERPWDMVLISKQTLKLKKGDKLAVEFFAKGKDLKFVLQSEDKSQNITRKVQDKGMKPTSFSIPVEKNDVYNIKFQFGDTGEYIIGPIKYEVK